jgi:hypothetical protein
VAPHATDNTMAMQTPRTRAAGIPVGEAGQQRAADEIGQHGQGERDAQERFRAGLGEDRDDERCAGDVVADRRQRPADEQRAELRLGEDAPMGDAFLFPLHRPQQCRGAAGRSGIRQEPAGT